MFPSSKTQNHDIMVPSTSIDESENDTVSPIHGCNGVKVKLAFGGILSPVYVLINQTSVPSSLFEELDSLRSRSYTDKTWRPGAFGKSAEKSRSGS